MPFASRASTRIKNPVALALEWGVRQLDQELELRTASGGEKRIKADVFPAYDEDGGLLVALTRARRARQGRGRPARTRRSAARERCKCGDHAR